MAHGTWNHNPPTQSHRTPITAPPPRKRNDKRTTTKLTTLQYILTTFTYFYKFERPQTARQRTTTTTTLANHLPTLHPAPQGMDQSNRKTDAYVAPTTIFVRSLAKPNSSKLDAYVAPLTIFVRSLAKLYYTSIFIITFRTLETLSNLPEMRPETPQYQSNPDQL